MAVSALRQRNVVDRQRWPTRAELRLTNARTAVSNVPDLMSVSSEPFTVDTPPQTDERSRASTLFVSSDCVADDVHGVTEQRQIVC
jgi:hypothetical protein